MDKFDRLIANTLLQNEIEAFEKKHKLLPTAEEVQRQRERILEKLRQKSERFPELPNKFYDNIKTKTRVVITGEQVATQSDLTTLTSLYQILSQQGDPRAETVLNMTLNLAGKNPVGLLGLSSGLRGGPTPKLEVAVPAGQEQE